MENLKTEIDSLKQDNNDKGNILAKVHLKGFQDSMKDNSQQHSDYKNVKDMLA